MDAYPAITAVLNALHTALQPDINSAAEEFGEPLGDISILPSQHHIRAVQHGDGCFEGGEHVSKLSRYIPTTDNDHGLRKLEEPHHRIGGVELHRAKARQIRDRWTAAGSDDNPLSSDRLRCGDVHLPWAHEACPPIEDGDIVALLTVSPAVRSLGVDPAEDAFLDVPPSDALKIQLNPKPVGLNRRCGEIGQINQHLAGNATNVEAGPAESAHLDDCDVEMVKPLIDDRVTGSGADNAKVKMPHVAIVPAGA